MEETQWAPVSDKERIYYEVLFYSQGPIDGYVLGEEIRNLLLKSGLSLTGLSQIWNLADVSNDNVLNVHEFVLIMHLIRGVMQGKAIPGTLPRCLTPPKTTALDVPVMRNEEKEAYSKLFDTLDRSKQGFIEAPIVLAVFHASGLTIDTLHAIWNLSDLDRDGQLDKEEFGLACHLIRYVKRGGSVHASIDVIQHVPKHLSSLSLQAKKKRVAAYEEQKQRLMSLKEKRKAQCVREAKRLELFQERLKLLQELFHLIKSTGEPVHADILKTLELEKQEIALQEKLVSVLKKEHERVRQETVKVILRGQDYQADIQVIKEGTNELNKRLMTCHTHATKDPDPFHQLYEQRKAKRKGSNIEDLDKIDINIPFLVSPFDPDAPVDSLPYAVIASSDNGQHCPKELTPVLEELYKFGDGFMERWAPVTPFKTQAKGDNRENCEEEANGPFLVLEAPTDDDYAWMKDGLLGHSGEKVAHLKLKLTELRKELFKLNTDANGKRIVLKNPSEIKIETEKDQFDKVSVVPRRSVAGRLRNDPNNRLSESELQAAREYRQKRYSFPANLESQSAQRSRVEQTSSRKTNSASTLPQQNPREGRDKRLSGSDLTRNSSSNSSKSPAPTKNDDDGVLKLKSSRKKDNLSLELASVALGRTIAVEQIPAPTSGVVRKPVSPTESKKVEDTKITDNKSSSNSVPQTQTSRAKDNSEVTSPINNLAPKKTRAPAPPAIPKTEVKEEKSASPPSTPRNEIVSSPNDSKLVESQVVIKQTSSENTTPSANQANPQQPQRPPRLKKRTPSNNEAVSPTSPRDGFDLSLKQQTTPVAQTKITEVVVDSSANLELKANSRKSRAAPEKAQVLDSKSESPNVIKVETKSENNNEILGGVQSSILEKSNGNISLGDTNKSQAYSSIIEVRAETSKDKKVNEEKEKQEKEVPHPIAESLKLSFQNSQSLIPDHEPDMDVQTLPTNVTLNGISSGVVEDGNQILLKPPEAFSNNNNNNNEPEDSDAESLPPPPLPSSAPPCLDKAQAEEEVNEEEEIIVNYTIPVQLTPQLMSTSAPPSAAAQETADPVDLIASLPDSLDSEPAPPQPLLKTSSNVTSTTTASEDDTIITTTTTTITTFNSSSKIDIPLTTATTSTPSDVVSSPTQQQSKLRSEFFGLRAPSPLKLEESLFEPENPERSTTSPDAYFINVRKDLDIGLYKDDEPVVNGHSMTSSGGTDSHSSMDSDVQGQERSTSAQRPWNLAFYTDQSTEESFIKPPDPSQEEEVQEKVLSLLEQQRRAVIAESRVTRKSDQSVPKMDTNLSHHHTEVQHDVHALQPRPHDHDEEDLNDSASHRSSNPSNYGYTYSAEREAPPPEVGWSDKAKAEAVNLYSENVVSDGNTTESVDRESIANLATTRQQWESIFTTHNTSQSATTGVKKKHTPKWEVRLPYEEKQRNATAAEVGSDVISGSDQRQIPSESFTTVVTVASSPPPQTQTAPDMESAIEREIRLAHEREEMLRAEKEERQRLAERQQRSSQGQQNIIASYEAVSAESEAYQPAYNELTEADRGPESWGVEARVETQGDDESGESGPEEENPNESIIEREIRLQNEREAELRKQRLGGLTGQASAAASQTKQTQQPIVSSPPSQGSYIPERQIVETYEEPREVREDSEEEMETPQGGENLIARELRELREREEEVRRMRAAFQGQKLQDDTTDSPPPPQPQTPAPTLPSTQQPVINTNYSNKRNSIDSTSSESSSVTRSYEAGYSIRNATVQPLYSADDDEDEDQQPSYFSKAETPIEREMRIWRERENELRRAKGLPELEAKEEDYYSSNGRDVVTPADNTITRPRNLGKPGNSMRNFASSRLQKEVQEQREREKALRSEGKLNSTPEEQQEHIQPRKYMEVTGLEKADGKVVRNFVTNKRSSIPSTPTQERDSEVAASPTTPSASPAAGGSSKKTSLTSGGRLFTYKEFKQTAESKIEKELREMREREEELRMQRNVETPR